MSSSVACRYYTERTLGWMMNNKVIVLLSVLSFCLFVSTLALAGQKNRAEDRLQECQTSLADTTISTTTETSTTETSTTEATTTTNSTANSQESDPAGRKRRHAMH